MIFVTHSTGQYPSCIGKLDIYLLLHALGRYLSWWLLVPGSIIRSIMSGLSSLDDTSLIYCFISAINNVKRVRLWDLTPLATIFQL